VFSLAERAALSIVLAAASLIGLTTCKLTPTYLVTSADNSNLRAPARQKIAAGQASAISTPNVQAMAGVSMTFGRTL
jgi:hypothetical protein